MDVTLLAALNNILKMLLHNMQPPAQTKRTASKTSPIAVLSSQTRPTLQPTRESVSCSRVLPDKWLKPNLPDNSEILC